MTTLRIAFASIALITGCSSPEPTARNLTPATRADFQKRCAPCHGETGRGDGPAAPKLTARPPSWADAAWQNRVTDEEIGKAIVFGGAAVGKSPTMPAIRDLEGKPELGELIALIRSFHGA